MYQQGNKKKRKKWKILSSRCTKRVRACLRKSGWGVCSPGSQIAPTHFQQTRLCSWGFAGVKGKKGGWLFFFTPSHGRHKRGLFCWAAVPLHHHLASRLHARVVIRLRREKKSMLIWTALHSPNTPTTPDTPTTLPPSAPSTPVGSWFD